jgi:Tfp pilus assembly protein PilN
MANINLISSYRGERVRSRKILRAVFAGICGVTVLGLATAGALGAQLLMVKVRIGQVDRDLELVRPILQEIEAAENARAALRPRLQTLQDAQVVTTRWHGILDGLKLAIPDETWLTSVGVEPGGEGVQVLRVHGMTSNQTRVGETMYRLTQQGAHYSKVDLRYTQAKQGVEVESVEFELGAVLADLDVDQEQELKDANTQSN